MAVYKVIQDIESEDKLLGPLSLKGLVYAGIVAFCVFIDFKLTLGGTPAVIKLPILLISLFPITLFGVLASPLGREQPTEVWLLSRIRFMFQSRKRIWNQSGITNLVTVTAPKKIEAMLTKNLSQDEVRSRLSALSTTLDSRGWAVKNVNVNLGSFGGYFQDQEDTERLINTSAIVQEVPVTDIHASDDILDENNNQTAQKFQTMMVEAEAQRRKALQEKLEVARNQAAEVKESEEHMHAEVIHDVKPLNDMPKGGFRKLPTPANPSNDTHSPQVTPPGRTAKLELAQSGNDLSVASIAKLAGRNDLSSGEVAISLH